MSANSRNYIRSLYTLDAVAQRVPEAAWDNASCCDGWSAREVGGHAAWLIRNIGSLAAGKGHTAEQAEAEVLGAAPAATVRSIVTNTAAALDQAGALQRVAQLPWGDMAIDDFIGMMWVDALTHAWDIADATGIEHGIDPAFAAAAHAQLAPRSDEIRGPGRFGAIVPSVDSDPIAEFIAFTGRTSARS